MKPFPFTLLALLVAALPSLADNENMALGNPSGAALTDPNNRLVEHNAYSIGYDGSSGGPKWVSWHLAQSDIGRSGRSNDFRPDPLLPEDAQIRPDGYRGSGYDRGHLCPSGDRTSDKDINSETFLMSNMLPQAPNLNQQLWNKFEEYCRSQLKSDENELYIVAGGVGSLKRIAEGKVNVPVSCWKIAVVLPTGDDDLKRIDDKTRVIAVLMPNHDGPEIAQGDWRTFLTSVDQIEEQTKLDLLSNVAPEIQKVLEAGIDTGRAPTRRDETAQKTEAKSVEVFQRIGPQMNRAQVEALVGKPESVTGSGLYIEVYALKDQSKVWIAWAGPFPTSKLLYVKHRTPAGDTELLQP